MSKRERLEDLGRIMEKCKSALEFDLFSFYRGRNKDFVEYFDTLSGDQKNELLHKIPYQVEGIKEVFYEILEIASGNEDE